MSLRFPKEAPDMISFQSSYKEAVARMKDDIRRRYLLDETKHGVVNLVALEEIEKWVDSANFGLEEIQKKKADLEKSGYDPVLKAELLKIYKAEEDSAKIELDNIADALQKQTSGEEERDQKRS